MKTAPALHGQGVHLPASSVVLIGPDHRRRRALAEMLNQLSVRIKAELPYYPNQAEVAGLTAEDCDAVLIDIEEDTDHALGLIEDLGRANPTLTAMVYARRDQPDLLLRCMESGARTLLQEPISLDALTTAMVRASARRSTVEQTRTGGKTFLFWSVKGGAGASTLAANFAVALAAESKQKVALVDLNLDLGDLAVLMDVQPKFSLMDAIHNAERLDWDLLSSLMVEHSSGVSLLAAPDSFGIREPGQHTEAISQVLRLLNSQYSYVVIDTTTHQNLPDKLLREFDTIFLVSQVDIPSLRHAQRLSAHLASRAERSNADDRYGHGERQGQVQIVLNRYDPRRSMIAADEIESTLKMPVAWRVPNDYVSVRDAGNTGILSALTASAVGKAVRQMAVSVCHKPDEAGQKNGVAKKKGWRLFA